MAGGDSPAISATQPLPARSHQLPVAASAPQLTSVNYLKLLRVLQEDDNIRTGDEWEAGDMGQPVGSCSCPYLGSVAPLDGSLCSQAGFGDKTDSSRAAGMGLRPWSWRRDTTKTGEECATPPRAARIVAKGAIGDPRQTGVSGPAKVPQCGSREGGGEQVGGPRPSRG